MMFPISCVYLWCPPLLFSPMMYTIFFAHPRCFPSLVLTYGVTPLLCSPMMLPLSCAHLCCSPSLVLTFDVSQLLCSPMKFTIFCAHLWCCPSQLRPPWRRREYCRRLSSSWASQRDPPRPKKCTPVDKCYKGYRYCALFVKKIDSHGWNIYFAVFHILSHSGLVLLQTY